MTDRDRIDFTDLRTELDRLTNNNRTPGEDVLIALIDIAQAARRANAKMKRIYDELTLDFQGNPTGHPDDCWHESQLLADVLDRFDFGDEPRTRCQESRDGTQCDLRADHMGDHRGLRLSTESVEWRSA